MKTLRRLGVDEALRDLPDLLPLSTGRFAGAANSLFLCALGFEDRCLAIPQALQRASAHFTSTCYVEYDRSRADNEINRPELERCLTDIGPLHTPIPSNSLEFEARLSTLVAGSSADRRADGVEVVFDISCCADWLLIRILSVLLRAETRLTLVYSEAATYFPTQQEYEARPENWIRAEEALERGVADVSVVSQHPGFHLDSVPDCVVLFPTFNHARSRAIIDFVDPNLWRSTSEKLQWLLGVPHLPEDQWRVDALRRINRLDVDAKEHLVSTFDYKDSIMHLDRVVEQLSDRLRITVAPIGSKLQSVGAVLFSLFHPEIRMVIAVPKEYNAARYSRGCKAMWMLPFGDTTALDRAMRSIGTIRIE